MSQSLRLPENEHTSTRCASYTSASFKTPSHRNGAPKSSVWTVCTTATDINPRAKRPPNPQITLPPSTQSHKPAYLSSGRGVRDHHDAENRPYHDPLAVRRKRDAFHITVAVLLVQAEYLHAECTSTGSANSAPHQHGVPAQRAHLPTHPLLTPLSANNAPARHPINTSHATHSHKPAHCSLVACQSGQRGHWRH